MKTYILKGKGNTPDVPFHLNDLLPLKQTKSYSFVELAGLIDYSLYYSDTNWTNEDYLSLYRKAEHAGVDFFTIRDTGIVVIPGTYLYPTKLTEHQIL